MVHSQFPPGVLPLNSPEDVIRAEVLLVSLLSGLNLGQGPHGELLTGHTISMQVGPLICTAVWRAESRVWSTSSQLQNSADHIVSLLEPSLLRLIPKSTEIVPGLQQQTTSDPSIGSSVQSSYSTGARTTSSSPVPVPVLPGAGIELVDGGRAVIKLSLQNVPLTAFVPATQQAGTSAGSGPPSRGSTNWPAPSLPSLRWALRASFQGTRIESQVVSNMAYVAEEDRLSVQVLVVEMDLDLSQVYALVLASMNTNPRATGSLSGASTPAFISTSLDIQLCQGERTHCTCSVPLVVQPVQLVRALSSVPRIPAASTSSDSSSNNGRNLTPPTSFDAKPGQQPPVVSYDGKQQPAAEQGPPGAGNQAACAGAPSVNDAADEDMNPLDELALMSSNISIHSGHNKATSEPSLYVGNDKVYTGWFEQQAERRQPGTDAVQRPGCGIPGGMHIVPLSCPDAQQHSPAPQKDLAVLRDQTAASTEFLIGSGDYQVLQRMQALHSTGPGGNITSPSTQQQPSVKQHAASDGFLNAKRQANPVLVSLASGHLACQTLAYNRNKASPPVLVLSPLFANEYKPLNMQVGRV